MQKLFSSCKERTYGRPAVTPPPRTSHTFGHLEFRISEFWCREGDKSVLHMMLSHLLPCFRGAIIRCGPVFGDISRGTTYSYELSLRILVYLGVVAESGVGRMVHTLQVHALVHIMRAESCPYAHRSLPYFHTCTCSLETASLQFVCGFE